MDEYSRVAGYSRDWACFSGNGGAVIPISESAFGAMGEPVPQTQQAMDGDDCCSHLLAFLPVDRWQRASSAREKESGVSRASVLVVVIQAASNSRCISHTNSLCPALCKSSTTASTISPLSRFGVNL
jgi:hypothetical protein